MGAERHRNRRGDNLDLCGGRSGQGRTDLGAGVVHRRHWPIGTGDQPATAKTSRRSQHDHPLPRGTLASEGRHRRGLGHRHLGDDLVLGG